MPSAAESTTPLTATFQWNYEGKLLVVRTVGDAVRFIEMNPWIEWMEHDGLRKTALDRLQAAADNAIHATAATTAFRNLVSWAKFL